MNKKKNTEIYEQNIDKRKRNLYMFLIHTKTAQTKAHKEKYNILQSGAFIFRIFCFFHFLRLIVVFSRIVWSENIEVLNRNRQTFIGKKIQK